MIQRKVLTPNDFVDLDEVEQRLLAFERRSKAGCHPVRVEVHAAGPRSLDHSGCRRGKLVAGLLGQRPGLFGHHGRAFLRG